jgi:hypothetical protein
MAVGTVALLGVTVDALIKVRAAHQRFREVRGAAFSSPRHLRVRR